MAETKKLLQKPLKKPGEKCRNLKEVKTWSVLEREEKLLLKKPKRNIKNTCYYMWMSKAAKSLSHNVTRTTTKMHQKFQNLS